jgi:NNP family nitrate/nitrite transporter-like MFS transporter
MPTSTAETGGMEPRGASTALWLGTGSFALCFAAWGLVGAFAPVFRERYGLGGTETALLVAVPVLLGALARLPAGLLADRFGGRAVFSILMFAAAVPVFLIPSAPSFEVLLALAFAVGLAGASFAVGVSYVSRWTSPAQQGSALGVFGIGTGGQSAAVFLAPLAAGLVGWPTVFRAVAIALVAAGILFALVGRNAPGRGRPTSLGQALAVLRREKLAWVLALFYFLTFGGFVAFAIYLPVLLRDEFGLSAADAGFRAAGFVVVATAARPLGGWLADRIGGARLLALVFGGVVPFALLMAWPAMIPYTVGALGCAVLLGLGNGAVFRLVPEHFPTSTGTVTGLVGALGGLGGFFPPLLLGVFRDRAGVVWPGFVLLAALALGLYFLNRRVFLAGEVARALALPAGWTRRADKLRAGAFATLVTGLLVAAIVVGSRNLQNFDAALVVYTFAVIFAAWGVAYHYHVWRQKPPTALYWQRTRELLRRRGFAGLLTLGRSAAKNLVAQTFIRQRSTQRWLAHQLLFWGCILAVAITFPLVFGWIHFTTQVGDPSRYVTHIFGFPVGSFRHEGLFALVVFHGLDIAAVLVLAGISLALWRRMRDGGAQALQSFGRDFFPLAVLFAISVTGLALTVSARFMYGALYDFLSLIHAVTVVMGLIYLPFGKFFHIFQRPAQLGVSLYREAGEAGPAAVCPGCGQAFASRMHIDDLDLVLGQLGFDYAVRGPAGTWQGLCPPCKRKGLARAQLRLREAARGETP